jgi:lipopolysaccharide assembly outer membrane protein LptD (OstA)
LTLGGGPEWLRGSISYVDTETEIQGPEIANAAEQIQLGFGLQLDDYWRFNARHQRDLQGNEPLLWSAALGYQDECISIDLGFTRDYTSNADGGGKVDSVFIRVNFKYLGGLGISQGIGNRDAATR